jgi:hypothetical protein
MGRTRVYLTVDVECAEERVIGGRPTPAQGYDVRVWGRFRNQKSDLGIGLIMRELEAFGFRGTFFTEVFGSHTFGIADLRDACQEMHGRGHDVQLHTHPIQRRAKYRTLGEAPAKDDIGAYTIEEQTALLREGVDILASCGVPREELLGFRAGNYGANNDTWAAMASAGLTVSSNYNPCYFAKNCKMRFDGSTPGLFRTSSGTYELPISNFVERGGGHRHMQITAVSLAEMKSYLWQARRLGIDEVTLVTHSFELCHIDSVEERLGRVNSVNTLRLRGLCHFLAEHADAFEVDTVGALAKRLAAARVAPSPARTDAPSMPRGHRRHKARRLIEQVFKRVEAKLPFSAPVL